MKISKKMTISILLTISMVIGGVSHIKAEAANAICETYSGTNVESQNYKRWSSPIQSYLTPLADGSFMRVQYGTQIEGLLVEYYDTEYNMLSSKLISEELPIFGGFYATKSNYYVVTGQENPEESAETEVFRITKYDLEWNKVASTGLSDCNTTIPFDAGSCRMDVCGKYLLIRTSHEMYQASDGYNHQANVTIQVDMDTMTVTDSYTNVMNTNLGYVSHSFNQFIKIDDNKIVAVDHGDAHPRSIALLKYQTDVSTGTFVPDYFNSPCTVIDVLHFPGEIGQNTTGASVGGFEISDTNYLIAGNTVVQDDNNLTRTTRNVFVASVDKATSAVSTNFLTSYEEGDGTTSTPQMLKLSKDEYLILWSRGGKVYYTIVDGTGEMSGAIYSMNGALSDCVPVILDEKIVWYTWNEKVVTFYDIDIEDLSCNNKTEIVHGHQYVNQGVTDGVASLKCSVCQKEEQMQVITFMLVYWNEDGGHSWSGSYNKDRQIGDDLYCWVNPIYSDVNDEIEILSSDNSIASVQMQNNTSGVIQFHAPGDVTITVRPKYNPEYAETHHITVSSTLKIDTFNIDKDAPAEFGDTLTLSATASGEIGSLQYKFYEKNLTGEITVIRDYAESSSCQWKPNAGIKTVYVDVKDETGTVVTKSIEDYVVNKLVPVITTLPEAETITYGETLKNSILSGGNANVKDVEVAGTFKWSDETIQPIVADSKHTQYEVLFIPDDETNYETVSAKVTLQVEPADKAPHMPSTSINVPNSLTKISQVELPDGWSFRDEDMDLELVVGESVVATAVYKDNENYQTSTIEITIYRSACEHTESDYIIDKEATCKETGSAHTVCTICYEELRSNIEIAIKENHSFDAGVITKQPTVTEEGIKTFTCTVCNEQKTENIAKLVTPDTDDSDMSNQGNGNPVTGNSGTGNSGNGNLETSNPGTSDSETTLPSDEKSEVNNSKTPNETQKGETVALNETIVKNGITYKVVKSGKSGQAEAVVVSAKKKKATVMIPDTIMIKNVSCKVTAILPKAFYKNNKMKAVVLGKHVKTIGKQAFYKCKNLKKFTIKSTVLNKVGKQAIKGIASKAAIKVPKKQLKAYKKLFGKKSGFTKTMKINGNAK